MKTAICLLISSVSAVWPAYAAGAYSTPTTAEIEVLGQNPYACMRQGLVTITLDTAALAWAYSTASTWFTVSGQTTGQVTVAEDEVMCCELSANGKATCDLGVTLDTGVYSVSTGYTGYALSDTDMDADFLLSAAYQPTPSANRVLATEYCDAHHTALVADTAVTLTSGGAAFTGLTKCTYFLTTAVESNMAPAFKLTSSIDSSGVFFWGYDLVVSEWMNEGETLTEGTDPFYAALVGVTLPSITQTTPVVTHDYTDMAIGTPYEPSLSYCSFASATSVKSMSDYGGYWNVDKTMTCAEIMKQNRHYNEWVANFEAAKVEFESNQELYNTARQTENERKLDFFRNAFDPVTVIPSRPAIPWTPMPYEGATISLTSPSSTTYNNVVFSTPSTRSTQPTD